MKMNQNYIQEDSIFGCDNRYFLKFYKELLDRFEIPNQRKSSLVFIDIHSGGNKWYPNCSIYSLGE